MSRAWFIHSVVLASVILCLIYESESKPQSPTAGSGECKCVLIDKCCDKNVNEDIGDLYRTGNVVIDVNDPKNIKCDNPLAICCDKCCDKDCKEIRPTTGGTSHSSNLVTAKCGIRKPDGVGINLKGFQGNQAQFGEFPWMVAVLKQRENVYVAGGSLVHPRVVLTAAHKVHGKSENLVARLGDWDLSASSVTLGSEPIPSQAINVDYILTHPQFDRSNSANNVALLVLEKEAKIGDTVMPICLPQFGQTFDDSQCIVTGWGKDVFGETGKYQKILKSVSVPAVSHSTCQKQLRNIPRLGKRFNLHSTLNCAGGLRMGEDACDGDGGSPLVCPNPNSNNPDEYVQMGVVAWGFECGVVGRPGVYGSIPQTVDWINQTIQRQVGTQSADVRG